jgi:hypothetical protein
MDKGCNCASYDCNCWKPHNIQSSQPTNLIGLVAKAHADGIKEGISQSLALMRSQWALEEAGYTSTPKIIERAFELLIEKKESE